MKKTISLIICVLIAILVFLNIDNIANFIADFIEPDKTVKIASSNEYKKNYDFKFVQMSQNYVPYSYQGLLNIIFSTLNNGWDTFTFYCPNEYTECLKDVNKISNDQMLLSSINNFVHPYNSFDKIELITSTTGEVTINVDKLYSSEEIDKINTGVKQVLNEIITEDMSTDDKILKIHDYIVNNTKYDKVAQNQNSFKAIGPLFEGIAVCSGYSDLMEIFLTELGLKNFKVASTTHIWNVVYINNEWLNIDLTWDDPITKDSDVDTLSHKFFLINKDQLLEFDTQDHTFDTTIYQELA